MDLRPQTVAELRLAAGPAWEDRGLVFTCEVGAPLDQNYIARAFARACASAGIRRRTVKETKHTFATLALRADVHPKKVQLVLGHSSIAITLDVYSHVTCSLQEDAMGHLDRLFGS